MVVAAPSQSDNLKKRSVVALRGLSDLGGVALVHELAARLVLPTSISAVLTADTQLLAGTLMGVWTVALFADRMREETESLIDESRDLPTRWDSSFIYTPSLDEHDVMEAVAWLYAFDELEGLAAADLMRGIAQTESPQMRLKLAKALAAFPVQSNVSTSVLSTLMRDTDPLVRNAAAGALQEHHALVPSSSSSPWDSMPVPYSDIPHGDDSKVRHALTQLLSEPLISEPSTSYEVRRQKLEQLLDLLSERVQYMENAALSKPDLSRLNVPVPKPLFPVGADGRSKSKVPLLDGLKLSEMHGICALASIPVGYELLSMVGCADLPLRFIGLGWLLSLGGLAVYPQSAAIWQRFKKIIDEKVIT